MESLFGIIENSGAAKILVMVGLCLFILSIVRQISWIELLDNSRIIARYTGIIFVAVGVYLEYSEKPSGNGGADIGGVITPLPSDNTPTPPSSGQFVVHFMSVTHQSSARVQLTKFRKKYAQYLGRYKPMIDVVNRQSDGLKMYRVNFGPFPNKDEADHICLQMLKHVDDCTPRESGSSVYVNLD